MGYSFFETIDLAPADPIFKLTTEFEEDRRPNKVNLSVGLYRDEQLQTPVLKTVKQAEKYLLDTEKSKEYLPISGDPVFVEETKRLIFGDVNRVCGIQTPGGTGALRVAGDFIRDEISSIIALPDPTWPNHPGVFKKCGFKIDTYGYYDVKKHQLNIDAIFKMLRTVPEKSVVLFHACCHNPTGADLSRDEWNQVATVVKERKLLPLFDFAYQGFGDGIEEDAYPIRSFVKQSIECVVTASYSKNFGLYSERVGALFITTNTEQSAKHVLSKLKVYARTLYSNPPKHGAAIVAHILSDPALRKEWEKEVDEMRHRIDSLRDKFVHALQKSYLKNRKGMFCYLGLETEKVKRLKEQFGIYMAEGGRMNLAGLSRQNFDYVITSLNAQI
mgnify:CR=1 FL=1